MTRQLWAEALGTGMLLMSIVASGIMAVNLSGGNIGLALLINAVATGAMLFVIITVLGPVSGAHFNPAVTLAFALRGDILWRVAAQYVAVQILGGIAGVWASHLMFEQPVLQIASAMHRTGPGMWLSEGLATFGLLFAIFGGLQTRPASVPALVALYVTGGYFFTASSGFANPAVAIARGFTDSFAGIYPGHIAAFVAAQLLATLAAHVILRSLLAKRP